MANKARSINDWIKRYLREEKPRSKSLIVTVFGDALLPNSGGAWLSELIELLQPLAVNERLVRTSCFRLIDEGWLMSSRDGRRSRYSLTPSGVRRFEQAYRRIYNPPQRDWNGEWTLVVFPRSGSTADRNELRNELAWEGFGALAPGIFAHPYPDAQSLAAILEPLEPQQRPIVLRAADARGLDGRPVAELTNECWNLSLIRDTYRGFIGLFEPVMGMASAGLSPENAFVLQTLLIHSFRRASLHDPRLPTALLGADWPGHDAYELCRALYRLTYRDTHHFLRTKLSESVAASVPDSVFGRFGGLSA